MNILSLRINISESLAFGRLHPQLQPNTLLVDGELFLMIFFFCSLAPTVRSNKNRHYFLIHVKNPSLLSATAEFLEEDMELLQAKGHKVERMELLSVVDSTRRTNDLITGMNDPRSVDASALTMSKMP